MAPIADKTRGLAKHVTKVAKSFGSIDDLQPLIDYVKNKRVVMLGEASHGTHEFYEWRRLISQELIEKHGFNFIAVEGDWPSTEHVNRYVVNLENMSVRDSLIAFHRWPTWIWANTDILKLVQWMRDHNCKIPKKKARAAFFGLDVYSLFESIQAALDELEKFDPAMAQMARLRYACFDPFVGDEMAYAKSLVTYPAGCRAQAVKVLKDLLASRLQSREDEQQDESAGGGDEERHILRFSATQNARIVANAEDYYRVMILGDEDSWNVRDRHMKETLDTLLDEYGPGSKAIVWVHNTHVGDYRATDMVQQGQVNLGGLARETYGEGAVALVGFGSYQGTVTASYAWGAPEQLMPAPPGRPGSVEAVFHEAASEMGAERLYVMLDPAAAWADKTTAGTSQDHAIPGGRFMGTSQGHAASGGKTVTFPPAHASYAVAAHAGGGTSALHRNDPLAQVMGHRAIGVVYHPPFERFGNYVPTALSRRYDAFMHFERTRCLRSLSVDEDEREVPETYPFGQ